MLSMSSDNTSSILSKPQSKVRPQSTSTASWDSYSSPTPSIRSKERESEERHSLEGEEHVSFDPSLRGLWYDCRCQKPFGKIYMSVDPVPSHSFRTRRQHSLEIKAPRNLRILMFPHLCRQRLTLALHSTRQ